MIREITAKGEEQGVKKEEKLLAEALPELKRLLKALVARDLWSFNEYYQIINEHNAALHAALDALQDGQYEKFLTGTHDKKRETKR